MDFIIKVREGELDKDVLNSLGFKFDESTPERIKLTLPECWKIIPSKTDKTVQQLADENGNIRGAFTDSYIYFRCRFDIATKPAVAAKYENETDYLYIVDRKNEKTICDMGTFEPYSDYAQDLIELARKWLEIKFPNWNDPVAYWNDEIE